jgi:hypothetical protein
MKMLKEILEFLLFIVVSALIGILFWSAVFNIDLRDVTIIRGLVDSVSTGLHNVLRRS